MPETYNEGIVTSPIFPPLFIPHRVLTVARSTVHPQTACSPLVRISPFPWALLLVAAASVRCPCSLLGYSHCSGCGFSARRRYRLDSAREHSGRQAERRASVSGVYAADTSAGSTPPCHSRCGVGATMMKRPRAGRGRQPLTAVGYRAIRRRFVFFAPSVSQTCFFSLSLTIGPNHMVLFFITLFWWIYPRGYSLFAGSPWEGGIIGEVGIGILCTDSEVSTGHKRCSCPCQPWDHRCD